MTRNTEQALAWAEMIMGGRIVGKRAQLRWRPQWFLDIEMPDGSVKHTLLRGWRTPGIVETEELSRARLRREAGVLAALDHAPVKSPAYYGYMDEGDWLLMEAVPGDDLLTAVKDPARQTALFKRYVEDMATLHRLDPENMDLPATLRRPRNPDDNARWNYRLHRANFIASGAAPDPLFELAWGWLDRHAPTPVARYALCTGDIGANQFLFDGDTYNALFDVEMAYIGDPAQDIGMMRYRNMAYPVTDFETVVRHYYACAGREMDIASLNYWTAVGLLGVSPTFAQYIAAPLAHAPIDQALMWGMHCRRRGLASLFHQIYSLPLPPLPERPHPLPNPYAAQHGFLARSIDDYFIKSAGETETHHLRFIRAFAEMARLCAEIGPDVTRLNIEDYASVLGRHPADEAAGAAALAAAIKDAPEHDLANRLAVLYRIESRREYLLEPAIHAVGFASFKPLDLLGLRTFS